jgi:hypothetical protein
VDVLVSNVAEICQLVLAELAADVHCVVSAALAVAALACRGLMKLHSPFAIAFLVDGVLIWALTYFQ